VDRLRSLEIPLPSDSAVKYRVKELLPARDESATSVEWRINFHPFALATLFILKSGDYHNISELPDGDVPLISCGNASNGICGFVNVPEGRRYRYKLTIAFNGMNTLTTKFHPYEFAAKDDVAVCTPIKKLRPSTLFFVQVMMAREQWRYNYYRKCFMEKLQRQSVSLPAKAGEVDEDTIEKIVGSSPYWEALNARFTPPAQD
jgi:hypothetical protein